MQPALPILIIEGLDVQAFSSVQSAQSHLETWWVKEQRGRAYDAHGRRMVATCRGQQVLLSLDAGTLPQQDELAQALRSHFRAIKKSNVRDDSSLGELVAALTPR